jgi:hypothetical protein
MLRRKSALALFVVACTASSANDDGGDGSGDGPVSVGEGMSGPLCDSIPALVIYVFDEAGNPVDAVVRCAIDGGPSTPASCPDVGRCEVSDGYGAPIAVHVEAKGCTYEVSAKGGTSQCEPGLAHQISVTAYDDCPGTDPSTTATPGTTSGDPDTGSDPDVDSGPVESSGAVDPTTGAMDSTSGVDPSTTGMGSTGDSAGTTSA